MYFRLTAVSLSAILLTSLLLTFVFYGVFRKEVMSNLRQTAYALKASGAYDGKYPENNTISADMLRITVIADDGKAVYDNEADIASMENHAGRSEIKKAMLTGEGEAIRHSHTIDQSMFYYAVRLNSGYVLRVARQSGSILGVFFAAVPVILVIILLLGKICMVMTDKELLPFVETINRQNAAMLKNASMRQEFTANVSHELKTPLTSISGYSELIADGVAKDKDAVKFAGEIHKNADRLLALINDIINLSELDSNQLVIKKENFDLYSMASEIISEHKFEAENRKVTLSLLGSSTMVSADRSMTQELISNLCDNAIRYNIPDGRADVMVGTVHENGSDRPYISVRDTGIGIDPEDQERVFERFYRVDRGRSRQTGGTGLGLAIVKHIAEQHHAKLRLSSRKGKGTDVTVVFQPAEKI